MDTTLRSVVQSGMIVMLVAMVWMSGHCDAMLADGPAVLTRPLVDTTGYARTPEQIEAVVHACDSLDAVGRQGAPVLSASGHDANWIAGICPHDDHLYAGRIYMDVMRNVRARHVVLFGVAHRARDFNVDGRLVFDSFAAWQGPYGPVKASFLRQTIMERLSPTDFVVNDSLQGVEHSVEGLIPFLQYFNRDVEIIPILVPYMGWERLDELSRRLAHALSEIVSREHLELGSDIAFLCSNDCIHYGDQGWGGKNYAPFGADVSGYEKALKRDQRLVQQYLKGKLESSRLKDFFHELVEPNDVRAYKITWCGRFSVPLGLNAMTYLSEYLGRPPLRGWPLGYDTSVAAGQLPVPEVGLGTTAPSSLHHWVGYAAVGYR